VAPEALKTALKMLEIVSENSTILYLGRSPLGLMEASNFLAPRLEKNDINHIHVNFSGTPNISNPRKVHVNDLRNVITQERLLHFCNYLDSKRLNKLTADDQLYITDQVGKSAGMNAFLRIMRHYYITYQGIGDTPKITLLLMNFNEKESHLQAGCYFYNPLQKSLIFSKPSITEGSYRRLMVNALPLSMDESQGGPLDALDDELVQYYLLGGRGIPCFLLDRSL
jgi:hypothetical protein